MIAVDVLDVIGGERTPAMLRYCIVTAGCALMVMGIALRGSGALAVLANFSLVILSCAMVVTLAELLCRVGGHNFSRRPAPGDEVPIYYRAPSFHAGEGVFRRPGPASWEGRVLSAYMRVQGWSELPYADERPVRVDYDQFGFRNPTNLVAWDIVVTGDSFVELGYLAYEDLFTTLAGQRLGSRIKNLGVSTTGPISQTFYLKHYGRSPSTKIAVLCFFEGNDLEDLRRERRQIEAFRATGRPWEDNYQPSLLKALAERVVAPPRSPEGGSVPMRTNAFLQSGGREFPITTFGRSPPAWGRLSQKSREELVEALSDWAATAHSLGLTPHVMYLPDGQRVFTGLVRYADPERGASTRSVDDFSSGLGAACTNVGIGFINAFPALRQAAESGHLPYNVFGDGHLTREGSQIVADVLAGALDSGLSAPKR